MKANRFDNLVDRLEAGFGQNITGLWLTLGLMMAAAVYVRPAIETVALGSLYARMASDPFTLIPGNYVGFRVLTPLISYLLGFRGQLIIVTNLLLAAAMLAAVYFYFRKNAPRSGDALLSAAIIAFSLVTLTTIYYGGYTDSLTYLIVFVMWQLRKRPWLYYALFMVGMLNRECFLFLIPWLIFLRWQERRTSWSMVFEAVVGLGLALSGVYLVRLWVADQGEVPFRAMYYWGPLLDDWTFWLKRSYPHWGLGLFSVFKLFWIIPVLAAIGLWREGRRAEVCSMALLFLCVATQLLIAFDSSRLLTLAFPLVIMGLAYLLQSGAFEFRRWAGILVMANFLVPQLYTAAQTIEIMHSIPGNLLMILLMGKDGW